MEEGARREGSDPEIIIFMIIIMIILMIIIITNMMISIIITTNVIIMITILMILIITIYGYGYNQSDMRFYHVAREKVLNCSPRRHDEPVMGCQQCC